MLGAVLSYGALVAPLQQAVARRAARAEPARLRQPLRHAGRGAEGRRPAASRSTPASPSAFDLAVVAEGGVFADAGARRTAALTPRLPADRVGRPGRASSGGAPRRRLRALHRATARRRCCRCREPDAAATRARRAGVVRAARRRPGAGRSTMRSASPCSTRLPSATRRHRVAHRAAEALSARPERRAHAGARPHGAHRQRGADAAPGGRPGPEPRPARRVRAGRARCATAPTLRRRAAQLEWQRAPDRWAMIAATDFLARSFTWRCPGAGAGARPRPGGAAERCGRSKSLLARQMMFGSR